MLRIQQNSSCENAHPYYRFKDIVHYLTKMYLKFFKKEKVIKLMKFLLLAYIIKISKAGGLNIMNEKELYAKLGELTKNKDQWKENMAFTASFLTGQSTKIMGKSLWLLGEMGLLYPNEISPFIEKIATFLNAKDAFLRERALNALGRIGRANYALVKPYWEKIFLLSTDDSPNVRLSFIWASENIATNTPEAYEKFVSVFEKLLDDKNVRVRIEAPEMFRVLGKRKPEYVYHCLDKLKSLSENDVDRIVRIHAKGAIKAIIQNRH